MKKQKRIIRSLNELDSMIPSTQTLWPQREPIADAEGKLKAIYAALEDSPPKEKEVVLKVAFEGMSYTQAAKLLGVTKATIQLYVNNFREKVYKIYTPV